MTAPAVTAQLERLAHCTANEAEMVAALECAVTIAQMGGVEVKVLEALLALPHTGLSHGTRRRLEAAGVDLDPLVDRP